MSRFVSTVVQRLFQPIITAIFSRSGVFFRVPVDPILHGVPNYFEVIDPKDARDLRTIKQNVQAGHYESLDGVEIDIQLMITNAVRYNGETSNVADAAHKMGKMWHAALAKKKKEDAKRLAEGGGGSSEPPTKKQKLL